LIVKQALSAYVNHTRIHSWNQAVLKAMKVKFLAQGNNKSLLWGSYSRL